MGKQGKSAAGKNTYDDSHSESCSVTPNWDLVNQGFEELHPILQDYVVLAMRDFYCSYGEDGWWTQGVLPVLSEDRRRKCLGVCTSPERIDCIDVATALGIIDQKWDEIFCDALSPVCRALAIELRVACEHEEQGDGGRLRG